MILGVALAGEPTAAALIVSAKSLLRFPEISKVSQLTEEESSQNEAASSEHTEQEPLEVDSIIEYFLLGSLTSWILAVAPVALLRG